jgi:N-acylglucosamine 2-epimerase/mannose-6-phosphate isomerase
MSAAVTDSVRSWLFDEALPFWAVAGIDRENGGYVEQLRLDGSNANADFKRVRVIGRQIYVFSHAALLGYPEGAALARHGYEFLTRNAWLGEQGGWARRLDRHGRVVDATPDLYDLAFTLYAFGWYIRATSDAGAELWALRTLDFIEARMRHPGGRGFLHEAAAGGPRQQNPHMHLLEAALVNLDATGNPRFRALADELVDLFTGHFFDPATGTLHEFFADDLSPLPGEAGRLTEPGHQFEWAWILANYQKAGGRDVSRHARALVASAERFGVDRETGITVNLVRDDGLVLDAGTRTWPNSERIQAAVAMFELFGTDPRPVFAESAGVLLSSFLDRTPAGTWIDQFDAAGRPTADKVPSSTLYHLMIAFAEMLRVEDAVSAAFPDAAPPVSNTIRRSEPIALGV